MSQASKVLTSKAILTSKYLAYTYNDGSHSTSSPSTAGATYSVSYDELGIPSGSTINWVRFRAESFSSPSHGTMIRGVEVNGTSVNNLFPAATDIDILSYMISGSNSIRLRFRSGTSNTNYPSKPPTTDPNELENSSTININDVTVTVDYTLPYTACGAPGSVALDGNNVAPGAKKMLSWSAATPGAYLEVDHYDVYRSTDGGSSYSLLQSVEGLSLEVTAPSTNGASYLYKVKAIASVSGYDSGYSGVATLTCSFSAPSVSGVKIDASAEVQYKEAGSNMSLSWQGANGTNNAIQKYKVYRNGSLYQDNVASSPLSVPRPDSGQAYTYSVEPVGLYSSGAAVNAPAVYGYAACSAPTALSFSANNLIPGGKANLQFSGAVGGGQYNPITGYDIYRSDTAGGEYSLLGSVVSSATSGSLEVTAKSNNGGAFYYKVLAKGQRLNSALSAASPALLCYYSDPVAPASLTLDGGSSAYAAPDGYALLVWSAGVAGDNNPVIGYKVMRNGQLYQSVAGTSLSVPANTTPGQSYEYSVVTVGQYSESLASAGRLVYTYGHPSAPTSVEVSEASPFAGDALIVSFDGAGIGEFNPIIGYELWRSATLNGIYEKVSMAGALMTEFETTASPVNGGSYYFKVKAVGARSSGALSTVYAAAINKLVTIVAAPTSVALDASIVVAGSKTMLRFSGAAAGQYNAITGYRLLRASALNGTYSVIATSESSATSGSFEVTANEALGGKYYFKVQTVGTRTGFTPSGDSAAVMLESYAYSACGAPSTVAISKALENPGVSVIVSWSGAVAGQNNPITKYQVWKSAGGGSYVLFQETAESSVQDAAPAAGITNSYKIKTIGTEAGYDSGLSAAVSVKGNTDPVMPGSVSVTPSIYESGNIQITLTAGSDVDGNLDHYEVQRRISTVAGWGAWEDISTALKVLSMVDAPTVGRAYKVQYQVCSVDALGRKSGYRASTEIVRNSVPVMPAVNAPVNGSSAYNLRPYVAVALSAEPDNQYQTVQLAIDGGSWASIGNLTSIGGVARYRLASALSAGAHVLKIRALDSLNAPSAEVTVNITVVASSWARTITALTSKIGNKAGEVVTSHQADILELYAKVNAVRAYYGLAAIMVPDAVGDNPLNAGAGKIGMWSAWKGQMQALQTAIGATCAVSGAAAIAWESVPSYPKASVINQIRSAIESL